MNKSAKFLYRRFVRKLESGNHNDETATLEDPTFDSSFAIPQKIVDHKEKDVCTELSDKELIEREKEILNERIEARESLMDDRIEKVPVSPLSEPTKEVAKEFDAKKENETHDTEATVDLSLPISNSGSLEVKVQKIRLAINKDGPYYPSFPGSDNPYRDGNITTPPKKARASYLFFQCTHRSEYQKRYTGASQGEIMTILGDTWRTMSEEEQTPYLLLAKEESEQYEKERQMMERAQKPNELWQPTRCFLQVLERL